MNIDGPISIRIIMWLSKPRKQVKPSQTLTHHTTLGIIYTHYKAFIRWNYDDNTFSNFIVVNSNASSMENET